MEKESIPTPQSLVKISFWEARIRVQLTKFAVKDAYLRQYTFLLLLFLKIQFLFFMWTSVLPAYLYAYASWKYLVPMKVERHQILWSWGYSYELLCGYWELILDSLQEEQVVLTTESSI